MPSQKCFLDEARTQEVEVSWRGIWKDIRVTHNETEVGRFANLAELRQGREFQLNDGSTLSVRFENKFGGDTGLVILHNGKPVKGTHGDPEVTLKSVFYIACFIGGINVLLGMIAGFSESELLRGVGAGYFTALLGLGIIALGYVAWKQRSPVALGVIVGLLALDAVLIVALNDAPNGRMPVTGIGLKILFIIQLARDFRAFRQLKEEQR